jgi:hypothetical protein
MDEQPERAVTAISVPMNSGAGMNASVGVAAPVGAVSRKDRERAGKTSLRREGTTGLLLLTALPGSVILQRRGSDGTWETLEKKRASRRGRTRIELPREAASSLPSFRVVFAPKNANITSWISENIDD